MSQLMDAKDLARWTRFANKGGIGKCTALSDCVAQGNDDLMFLADDEITVLMQLPEESVFLVRAIFTLSSSRFTWAGS
jgi:hypothetical protein